jgi:hypothetical protein
MQEEGQGQQGGWLPPDPGGRPDVQPAQQPGAAPPPPQQPQPPPPPGWQQPPPQQPPPGWYPPPPQPPPGYWWPQQQQWGGWQPVDQGPGNSSAIASFVLAIAGIALLTLSFGFASPLTLILGAIAIPFGVKGRRAVDNGDTRKHRGLAQAGFWIGIATVVLSILAIAAWTALLVSDDNFWDELEEDFENDPNSDPFESARVVATVV